jgi:HEAT repeat protein
VQRLRVFLSSPGDVADERAIALEVLERLQYEPVLRGRVALEVVAWDKPGAGAPILASVTPQASIDLGLPRPSECDIVVVVLWARMGTPLPFPEYRRADGEAYASGTEWEFEDAVSGSGQVLLYRRTAEVMISVTDPDRDERLRQFDRVRDFFGRLRDPETGAIRRGHKEYPTSERFRDELTTDLREVVHRLVVDQTPVESGPPLWQGSPFPGLRAFTPRDAPIYFGRGRETDQLVDLVSASRFVAVVGASGSGKSSLVGAGLIPRLAARGWVLPEHNGNQWIGLRFTPGELGDDPFLALAAKLGGGVPREIAHDLRTAPEHLAGYLTAETLVFVDQFEELFTTVAPQHVEGFIAMLENPGNGRFVVTVRSDFYHRCVEIPALAALLENGQFPLSTPTSTLIDMITRPAERAGLRFEEGLAGRILDDTGKHPGALPLLAYTLDELCRTSRDTKVLGEAAYERLGGVRGAIGTRAEDVFQHRLDDATRGTFNRVFRELVEIDEQGQVARRRVPLSTVATDEHARRLIDVCTEARLLVQSGEPGEESVVSAAHEALFGSWARLRDWIELTKDDLRLLRRVRAAAREWSDAGRADAYLWQHERLVPVYEMIARLEPALDPLLDAFTRPEHERLLATFGSPRLEAYRRQNLIDRLVTIGEAAASGLLTALVDGEAVVRNAAATTLARIGEGSVPGLLDAARHPDAEVRLAALGALRQIGGPRVVPEMARALHDVDDRVRSLASGALTALGGPEAASVLAAAASDADLDVRWRAVGTLGAFGEAAVGPLLLSMRDNDLRVRTDALAALRAVSSHSADALVEALRDPEAGVRAAATEVLGHLDDGAIPSLLRATDDDDPDVRWRVAEALDALGYSAPIPELIRDLPSTVDALVRHGPAAVAPLREVLMSDRPNPERAVAATALSRLGHEGGVVLVSALEDPRPQVWLRAMDALTECSKPPTNELLELARHHGTEQPVREAAVAVLVATSPAAALTLQHASGEGSRIALADGLAKETTSAARKTLLALLVDDDRLVREAAARSAGAMGTAMLPQLFPLVRGATPSVWDSVAQALRAVGGDAVQGLLVLAGDDDQEVRDRAVAVLVDIGTPAALFGLAERGVRV